LTFAITDRAATTKKLGQHRHYRLFRSADAVKNQLFCAAIRFSPRRSPLKSRAFWIWQNAAKVFGVQEQLSVFFKLPMTKSEKPEHALYKQEEMLLDWLKNNI
jgi:hypothetical protein